MFSEEELEELEEETDEVNADLIDEYFQEEYGYDIDPELERDNMNFDN